jgi:hypothetical protein
LVVREKTEYHAVMIDENKNGVADNVEIAVAAAKAAESHAKEAASEAEKAKTEFARVKATPPPLYDRVVMRLVVPFALAFAAPIATYYFDSKVESNAVTIDKLDKTVDRLERLVVQVEMRRQIRQLPPVTSAPVDSAVQPKVTVDQLVEAYIRHQRQVQDQDQNQNQDVPTDIDKFLRDQGSSVQSQVQQEVQ